MSTPATGKDAAVRARKAPREDATPQTVIERQDTLSGYLLRRAQRRREKFLQRAETLSFGQELARSAYLVACILVDGLAIPELILVLPAPYGWIVATATFVVALWAEYRVYRILFSLEKDTNP